jgi:hypothetical protein
VTTRTEPPLTLPEALTAQFYEWERRGRGWEVWPYRVRLEPPFRPFFHTLPLALQSGADDGRHPTLISGLVDRLLRRGRLLQSAPAEPEEPQAESADPWNIKDSLVEIEIAVPPTLKVGRESAEQLLVSLTAARHPVSFELIGTRERIVSQISCRESDDESVRQQVKAHFPEAVLVEPRQALRLIWEKTGKAAVVVGFGLAREFMIPLRVFKSFDADPLVGIAGTLSGLGDHEMAVFQVLLQAAHQPWAESVMRAVSDGESGSFFADSPEMVHLAREKVSRPLFSAVVRVGARTASEARSLQVVRALGGTIRQFGSPGLNELIPLETGFYDDSDHEEDLLSRWSRRCGVLLNSDELVSLAHLPSASVRSEKLARQVKKTKAAPATVVGQRLVLGENLHDGKTIQVGLTSDQRVRHTYVIGASGTGKSTLLLNMIVQDIKNGEGVGVLDPHGDLIDQILGHVPEERLKDVVLLDPADEAYPVGFNILRAHSEVEKNLLASDLVSVFRRLSTSWGDQMTSVLGNAVLAFLESEEGGTLADLRRFLIEPDFRRAFLATVRDTEVVYFWQKEFPLLAGKPQAPLLTRLDTFLRPKLIRYMVSQKEDRLDFGAIMNGGKIVLAKLAQGAIGEENAYLLGTLLVSKVQQLAMSRQEVAESERRPFYLYIDEFHNFVTPSMAAILSGARKYRLGLILAHQDLRQIASRDPELANSVLGAHTRICFRVGDQDAQKLAEGFSVFTEKDLQNLGIGEAICRIERSEYDFNLRTVQLQATEVALAQERRASLTNMSRATYARPRAEVEAVLQAERLVTSAPEQEAAPIVHAPSRRTREVRAPDRIQESIRGPLRDKSLLPPQASSTPGRGGLDHKYWQSFIKAWADKKGYRATIEKQVLDGAGSIDVAVESTVWSVAFEISVTSTLDQELKNVQKCLAAGFQRVVLVLPIGKAVARARERIGTGVDEQNRGRLHFVPADELPRFFSALEAEAAGTEGTVQGYKVKVEYKTIGEAEMKDRRRRISDVLLRSLRKLTG